MSRLIALYPRDWRARYEDEYLALLADRPNDPRDSLDIVRGALDARLHPQLPGSPKVPVEAPPIGRWPVVAGWATLLGAVLWYFSIVLMANGPVVVDGLKTYRDGSAAAPFFLLSVLLLGAGMLAVVVSLRPSRPAHAAAYISSLSGLLWGGAPWLMWAGLVAFVGLIAVGASAWRSGAWPAWRFGVLVASLGSAWGLAIVVISGMWVAPPEAYALFFLLIGVAWPIVGTSLVWPRRQSVDASPGSRRA
jgi:hypothetical protein